MVHHRLNEREANPNPYVNFIVPLPVRDAAAQEDARQLLRALMAQVKPVMKAHQLQVNSIEEIATENLKFRPQERSGILTCQRQQFISKALVKVPIQVEEIEVVHMLMSS
ncbi:hypothetical protein BC835DRAFT_1529008 [Cytidiella melzeri]|nr:hypothetical protein BC835DRAFT_1529008 [Cytidiella melzeri]